MTSILTSKSLVLFKGQRVIKKSRRNLVKKEYKVIRLLQKYVKLSKYLPTNVELDYKTISYDYIKGITAGTYLTDFGYKEGLFTRESFNKFINFHLDLSKVKDKRLFVQADKYGFDQVLAELTHYKTNNPEILTKKQWKLLFTKIVSNKNIF